MATHDQSLSKALQISIWAEKYEKKKKKKKTWITHNLELWTL